MQIVQSLQTRTTLAMTQRMQASLRILQMNNRDLTEYLSKKAEENPYLEVRLPQGVAGSGGEDFDRVAALESQGASLYGHVSAQIDLAFSDKREVEVAYAFLEALEPSGWMLANPLGVAAKCGVPRPVAHAVLERMKGFEPAGLFAGSLAECLMIQAEDQGVLTWELKALIENLDMLADGRTSELAEICDCEPEDIPEITAQLRQFNPKPGLRFDDDRTPVFPPDLTARRSADGWVVELNRSSLPAIEVAKAPKSDASAPKADSAAKAFRSQALSEARWLASTLVRRQTTLLQTATVIIENQGAFLEEGPSALQPLSLADVGEALELHPSTISRAIAGRMIQTPIGSLPLKSFFSRAFPQAHGEEAQSQDAVIHLVRKIVEAEDPERPLSDTAIMKAAAKDGVKIARRTVAKFRGILGIASSYDRRRKVEAA
ncbi:MAG: RNA polymerase factor sigma-54 [Pseudomonadota bacterium]